MEQSGCLGQRSMVFDIVGRHDRDGCRQVAQDLCEQFVIDMQVDGLAGIRIACPFERQGDASLIEAGLEAGRSFERSDIELVGVVDCDFGLVRNWFAHAEYYRCRALTVLCAGSMIGRPGVRLSCCGPFRARVRAEGREAANMTAIRGYVPPTATTPRSACTRSTSSCSRCRTSSRRNASIRASVSTCRRTATGWCSRRSTMTTAGAAWSKERASGCITSRSPATATISAG